jgi:hypothetical protein
LGRRALGGSISLVMGMKGRGWRAREIMRVGRVMFPLIIEGVVWICMGMGWGWDGKATKNNENLGMTL